MATNRPRSLRGIGADIERANQRVRRSFAAAVVAAVLTLGGAAWAQFYEKSPSQVLLLVIVATSLVVSAWFTQRLYRVAAVVLLLAHAVLGVWLITRTAIVPIYAGYLYLVSFAALSGALEVFRLPGYYREYQSLWKPHQITPGEVYTVRDGSDYSVVKVLAVEPDRVHIKQFGLRYPERPWQVKSSTLARDATVNGGRKYPHLPLDFAEFLRWEPVLLRKEPLAGHELTALKAWVAIHGEPDGAQG